ncbi:Gamma-aminobutyric acid receptor subunit theta [Durusdinium trenchii]|uniref:Gamma-aminobutyric acid receptor subunit theta n=2 Tax=Durusdinium trenchii TaxID=1381693 RepID=A0ABP0JI96_9DINO
MHWFLPNTLSQRLAHCRTGGMKVNVMTLSGDCMATSFDQSDTMRDLALWIRTKMGIPVAVQHLVKDDTVFKDPSLPFRDAFHGAEEVSVTVLRRPYTAKEREELFTRLVRATVAGQATQIRELLKEGAPVNYERAGQDVSVCLEHWEELPDQVEAPKESVEPEASKEPTAFGLTGEDSDESLEELKSVVSGSASAISEDEPVKEEAPEEALPCGGLSPLLMALATGREELARDFRQIGAAEPDLVPKTPSLRAAVTQLNIADITRHLMAGADPDTQLQRGEGIRATESGTLLHACAANHKVPGIYEIAQLLIHKKANLDAGDSEGDTPLAHARYFNAPELFKLYSGSGASIAGPFYARWENHGVQALRHLIQVGLHHVDDDQ